MRVASSDAMATLKPAAGCGPGVDGAEPVDADASVALGGFEAGVAEHFGDVADVGAAFEHQGKALSAPPRLLCRAS